nr:MAG TPA: hypothetical protein [Crassvirales sp.]
MLVYWHKGKRMMFDSSIFIFDIVVFCGSYLGTI